MITGAAFGIGRATAELFAREGARLIATDIQREPLLALADELRQGGAEVETVVGDVSVEDDARRMIGAAADRFGRLDVLVANAGIIPLGDVIESTAADWDDVMAIDGRGMFLTCKFAIEAMLPTGGGAIVCLSSISGLAGQKRQSAYGPAKFVATGLTKHLAVEWADRGIRVNAVAPARSAPSGSSNSRGARRRGISRRHRADAPDGPPRRTGGSRQRHRLPRLRRRLVHHRRGPASRRGIPRAIASATVRLTGSSSTPISSAAQRSNPLCNLGIDRLVEKISRNLGPFGAPLTGPLIGLQFRKRRGDIGAAVDEVTQHSHLRTLRRDRRDRGLRLVDAPSGRQARTKQTTRSPLLSIRVLLSPGSCPLRFSHGEVAPSSGYRRGTARTGEQLFDVSAQVLVERATGIEPA